MTSADAPAARCWDEPLEGRRGRRQPGVRGRRGLTPTPPMRSRRGSHPAPGLVRLGGLRIPVFQQPGDPAVRSRTTPASSGEAAAIPVLRDFCDTETLERLLRHAGRVDIELLVVPDCPNEGPARHLTLAVLSELGIAARVSTTVIATEHEARARGFTGSPTILINGRDPFGHQGASVGVACRVYSTPAGPAGVPPHDDLRDAVRRDIGA